jgi:hypothetical protein
MASVFISHDWDRGTEDYRRVFRQVEKSLETCSGTAVEKWKPVEGVRGRFKTLLEMELKSRVKKSDIFILIAHPKPSDWVEKEVEFASAFKKVWFAVKPDGYENASRLVREYGIELYDPHGQSINSAVRHALQELRYRREK